MAIGYGALEQANLTYLNQTFGNYALQLRSWADEVGAWHDQVVVPLAATVDGVSQAGLLAVGFTAGDAVAFAYKADVLNTIPALYYGRAVQPEEYNFDLELAEVRGPRIR